MQNALVAGYLGYRVAYDGMSNNHKAIDVAFISLSFRLIARVNRRNLEIYGETHRNNNFKSMQKIHQKYAIRFNHSVTRSNKISITAGAIL